MGGQRVSRYWGSWLGGRGTTLRGTSGVGSLENTPYLGSSVHQRLKFPICSNGGGWISGGKEFVEPVGK